MTLLLALACADPTPDATGGDPPVDAVPEIVPTSWSPPEWDPEAIPENVPTLAIEIASEAMARLDADPFTAADEVGVFIDDLGRRHEVDLNYRGAYQLRNVMNAYDLRNWKVKLARNDPWQRRREWNLNYEPHMRQKLAYDLFRFAGVPVPGAQHVLLTVNGVEQGLYLLYEDPDNEGWLWDEFGDGSGDLYKAATDLPDEEVCWADLTWLGPEDADYLCHYNKKPDGDDYSVIRTFVTELDGLSDEDVETWFDQSVDVERLLSFLAVSNFIANWDSYPQRPKNYWLYHYNKKTRLR